MAEKEIWKTWPEWLGEAVRVAYANGEQVITIAAVLQRSEAQVRAKLVRDGVYVSATSKRKQLRETVAETHGF